MYRIALAITVLGTVLYHLAQKLTSRTVNPFLALAVTYLVALAACLAALAWYGRDGVSRLAFSQLNWASAACGVAIFFVEVGVLLAYRSGWNIKTLGLAANTAVAVILVPVGITFFRERVDLRQGIGIVLCLGGLILLFK